MNYNQKNDETLLDEVNSSGSALTKEEQIRKQIEDFNKSDQIWGQLSGITYRDLLPYYEPIPFRNVIYGVESTKPSTFILPSKGQRGKVSPVKRKIAESEDYGTSTWNYDAISDGMISWITQTSVPTIKINTLTYSEYKLVGMWDGESKFQMKWRWASFPNSKVWRVLDERGNFNDVEDRFIKVSNRWDNSLNKKNVNRLKSALKEFKNDFVNTNNQFITTEWLNTNGYCDICDYLFDFQPNIILERKNDGCESESYHREGSRMANQSPVNLTMTMIKDAWYDSVVYDNTKNPRDVHTPAIESACFTKSDKFNPFLRNINTNIFGNEYNELDKYIYHFLTSCLINIDGTINIGYVNTFNNRYYNGVARPYDEKGTLLVQNQVADYIEHSKKNKNHLDNSFKKVFNMVEAILGYNRTTSDKIVGLNNQVIIDKWKLILDTETETLRNKLLSIGVDRPGNLGTINKLRLQQKELLYPVLLSTLGYTLENPNLSETHITDVLSKVIDIISESWHDYVWNFKIDLNENEKSSFKFSYTEQDWKEVLQGSDLNESDEPTFGPLYHFNGGNIEKIYAVFDNFYYDVIKPQLEEEYQDASTTSKERLKFLNYLRRKLGTKDLSLFVLFNTRDSILRKITEFDVGHLDPDSEGGVLRNKMWIFEFNKDNRHKFKVNQKSFELFWKEMMANTNDIISERWAEFIKNPSDETSKNLWMESDLVKKNLKIVLEYFGIEYDETCSFKNGTIQLDSYVNELEEIFE